MASDLFKLVFALRFEDEFKARLKKSGDFVEGDGWRIYKSDRGYFVADNKYPALGSTATVETPKLIEAADMFSWFARNRQSPFPDKRLQTFTMVKPKPAVQSVPVKPKQVEPAPVNAIDPEISALKAENQRLEEQIRALQDNQAKTGYR